MSETIYLQLGEDLKSAMKMGEKERLSAIRMLKSALLENKTSKAPLPEQDVVIKHAKKINDSLALYPSESEAANKIERELKFLDPYLPKSISETEVRSLITEAIKRVGANFGLVMKEISPQIKGRFDGKKASEIVKEML